MLKKHYGSTLNEYSALLCTMAYKRGHADGYRKAKGGKKSTRIKAEDVVAFVVGEIGWEATDNQVVETFDVLSLLLSICVRQSYLFRPSSRPRSASSRFPKRFYVLWKR